MPVVEYELWDMESANRLGAFPTRQEAFDLVEEMFRKDGAEAVASLALGELREGASGDVELRPIAQGRALLAHVTAASREVTSSARSPLMPSAADGAA